MPRHFGADRRHRQEIRSTRSTSWSPATPTAPMSARSTGGSSPQATNTARSSPRSISSSIPSRATSSAPRPTTPSCASATLAKDPEQTALIEAYDRLAAPIANRPAGSVTETLSRAPNNAGESPLGDIIADAQLAATSAEANGGAVIAFTNPGGVRADITRKEGRRGDLCRPVRQPAVPQPAGDDDADRKADQGHAGAAMARSEAAADPAGVEGLQLCMGRIEAATASACSPSACR